MTPLKLELSGFTCFKGRTELEFAGLGLFAIAGPTGAGKTTLLDAITYAIYGQTPRLGKQGLEALISPGEAQLYVTLDFATAQGSYRVTRTADRKPSGKVERNTRILELGSDAQWRQLPESEKLREADAKLEELVGLDYDGFTRSVLLPQGAFDEFLRGDPGKRRKLLVSLLGLDRVEAMQREAGRRAREAESRARNLLERLEQDYADATPERRRALKQRREEVRARRQELEARRRELREVLQERDALRALVEEQAKVERARERLAAEAEEVALKRQRASAARRAAPIAPLAEQLERLSKRAGALAGEVEELADQERRARQVLAEADGALDEAQTAQRERLPELGARLGRLAAAAPRLAQLAARGGSLALAERAEAAIPYSEAGWEALGALEAQLPGLEQALTASHNAEREARAAEQALLALGGEQETLAAELEAVKAAGKEAAARRDAARERYEQARLADEAASLRAHLHEGDTCPVCQRVIEQLPESGPAQDLNRLKAELEAAEAKRGELLERYNLLKAQLEGMAGRLSDRSQALEQARERAERAAVQLEQARAPFAALEQDDPAALRRRLRERRSALLAAFAKALRDELGDDDPAAEKRRLEAARNALEQALKRAEANRQRAQADLERSGTLRAERARQLAETQAESEELATSLNAALERAGFAELAELKRARLPEAQLERLEVEVAEFERQQQAAEERSVELQSAIAGRRFDAQAYAELKREQAALEAGWDEANGELARLEHELESVTAMLGRAAELREAQRQARAAFELYRVLAQDLRGNEFQEYLLGQVQAKLAHRASHILREVTAGRYDLRLLEGDYQVIDAWNGGEPRHAKTLSGGETFITSLALALALSDTIAGHALGALFLDEGFGTLDADTLDAVTSVLEALTTEGRMVGVITHVQELTERLPARLTVAKGPEGSSLSWDLA